MDRKTAQANGNHIEMFFHCSKCIEQKPEGVSPREWGQLEVGYTKYGVQVWCKRHEKNVWHLKLGGEAKLEACTCDGLPIEWKADAAGR